VYAENLQDPRFLQWVEAVHPIPIKPEPRDFELSIGPLGYDGIAVAYREAQLRKLTRLYHQWVASQN
jgi:hypothetical protein